MNIVSFEDVSKTYRMGEVDVTALSQVSFGISKGGFATLAGPSGSGKTTALNLIGCLDSPTAGEVIVAGQPVSRLDRRRGAQFRGEKLGFVFQDFNLQPGMTWTPLTDLELNLRVGIPVGPSQTEFGEKPDVLRPEIWARYYF